MYLLNVLFCSNDFWQPCNEILHLTVTQAQVQNTNTSYWTDIKTCITLNKDSIWFDLILLTSFFKTDNTFVATNLIVELYRENGFRTDYLSFSIRVGKIAVLISRCVSENECCSEGDLLIVLRGVFVSLYKSRGRREN